MRKILAIREKNLKTHTHHTDGRRSREAKCPPGHEHDEARRNYTERLGTPIMSEYMTVVEPYASQAPADRHTPEELSR